MWEVGDGRWAKVCMGNVGEMSDGRLFVWAKNGQCRFCLGNMGDFVLINEEWMMGNMGEG